MKFDYYTAVVSEREVDILNVHLQTLFRFCPEQFKVKVSTPLSIPPLYDGMVQIVSCPLYSQKSFTKINLAGYDFCHRIHKLISAGTSPWFVVSHSDIIYTGSMISSASRYIQDNVGMIGLFPHGLTIINREAYNNCHIGFWPLANIFLEPTGNLSGFTSRSNEACIICSPDVSELLRLEMEGLGYGVVISNTIELMYVHVGAQSGHGVMGLNEGKEEYFNELNRKKLEALSQYK